MASSTRKCFTLFLMMLVSSCGATSEKDSKPLAVGSRVPNFSLKSLDGSKFTNKSLEGQVAVLNFWATWCVPCAKEIPDLKEFAATSGAKVIGIALDEEGAKSVKPYVERFGLNKIENYVILLGDQELFQRFNGFGIPYTLVLDRSQRIVKIYRGVTTKEALEQDVKSIGSAT